MFKVCTEIILSECLTIKLNTLEIERAFLSQKGSRIRKGVKEKQDGVSPSGSTPAGNTPGMSSYANVTGNTPSKKALNFHTLYTPGEMGLMFLCRRSLLEQLAKEDIGNVPVWVKLYSVPVTDFSEDGLSVIATKIGTPLMLDSYTSDMCLQSWSRSSYARAMIVLRAGEELKDTIMVVMPRITGEE
nr:hypothetical protein [Tanacetum cinerariifolium]